MYNLRHGAVAEWLRNGLQNRLHRFNSGRRLQLNKTGEWWNGIHEGLKIPCLPRLVGSNPTSPTKHHKLPYLYRRFEVRATIKDSRYHRTNSTI